MYIFKGLVELFLQLCTVCEHACLCMYCSEHEPLCVRLCVHACVYVCACVLFVYVHTQECVYAFVHLSLCVCPCTCVCVWWWGCGGGNASSALWVFISLRTETLSPSHTPASILSHHHRLPGDESVGVLPLHFLFPLSFSFSRILIFAKNYRLEMRGIALRAFSFSFWKKISNPLTVK
jgi:hypothetical protein